MNTEENRKENLDPEEAWEEAPEPEGLREEGPEALEKAAEPEEQGPLAGFWWTFFIILFFFVAMLFSGFGGNVVLGFIVLLLLSDGLLSAAICWIRYVVRQQREINEKLDRLLADKPSEGERKAQDGP